MKTIQINNAVWKEDDYFVAQCLNIDVSNFGDTREEAFANLQEALELHLEGNDYPEFNIVELPEIIGSALR